ncbi:etnppl, partial [Symbiodinium microadriaticum]
VKAGQEALGNIQTNQRFLHPGQQRYLSKLLSLFPPELNTVYLVNSGSEANDLALRMARAHTAAPNPNDVIVLDNAYHGNTSELIDISPYKWSQTTPSFRDTYKKPHVHVVTMPLTSSARMTSCLKGSPLCSVHSPSSWRTMPFTAESGNYYAKEVEDVITSTGGVGVFIAESAMGCGGQVLLPPQYLSTCYAAVRSTGGVCIADEVQTGFGRSGSGMWMFERHGVVPDIVTLGKPMGNGYPLSAVVCRRAIAESFAESGMEYFNTFGGNSVACAIGEAVLDTIAHEGLIEHTNRVGTYLSEKLFELRESYPLVLGDIRGCGLFQGIEFIRVSPCSLCDRSLDSSTCGCPVLLGGDEELAQFAVDFLQQNRIVASRDACVMKFKPPLVIREVDIDVLIKHLDECIAEWLMHHS